MAKTSRMPKEKGLWKVHTFRDLAGGRLGRFVVWSCLSLMIPLIIGLQWLCSEDKQAAVTP